MRRLRRIEAGDLVVFTSVPTTYLAKIGSVGKVVRITVNFDNEILIKLNVPSEYNGTQGAKGRRLIHLDDAIVEGLEIDYDSASYFLEEISKTTKELM